MSSFVFRILTNAEIFKTFCETQRHEDLSDSCISYRFLKRNRPKITIASISQKVCKKVLNLHFTSSKGSYYCYNWKAIDTILHFLLSLEDYVLSSETVYNVKRIERLLKGWNHIKQPVLPDLVFSDQFGLLERHLVRKIFIWSLVLFWSV